MGEFHRNNISKSRQNRKPTVKKQLRDVLRLLERPNLPEELKTAKMAEAKELKGSLKN